MDYLGFHKSTFRKALSEAAKNNHRTRGAPKFHPKKQESRRLLQTVSVEVHLNTWVGSTLARATGDIGHREDRLSEGVLAAL